MRLLCVTDIHGNYQRFEQILLKEPEPDILIIGGDLTNFGTPQEAEQLLDLAQLYCPHVFAVAGNCDNAAIDDMLRRRGVTLHRTGVRVNDIGFFGLSAMPPWRGNMYEFTEEELDGFLAESHARVQTSSRLIMVSHAPPCNTTVDRNSFGKHVGSIAVRTWVERVEPVLVVCGHIHEARGMDQLQSTRIVNCGPCRQGYYAVVEVAGEVKVELHRV